MCVWGGGAQGLLEARAAATLRKRAASDDKFMIRVFTRNKAKAPTILAGRLLELVGGEL